MDVIEIDETKALAIMAEVVKGNEEYVYDFPQEKCENKVCVYQHAGKPSCLIGQVLFKAGVTIEELAQMDADMTATTISAVTLPERLSLTPLAKQAFRTAQSRQDNGSTWEEAYEEAEDVVELYKRRGLTV